MQGSLSAAVDGRHGMIRSSEFVVLGGGIAGLTIAREIARAGRSVVVVEKGTTVGGLSRTLRHDGFSCDIGGHRFHSNNSEVVEWLRALMGSDLVRARRRSRIRLGGRFIDYPIRLSQAIPAFGPARAARAGASYLAAIATRHRDRARSFEQWVTQRFGRGLYEIYFEPYTEKVWGIPCAELSADWAAQRISLPSLTRAVYHALVPSRQPPATIITDFLYPRLGYGTISDRLAEDVVAAGQTVLASTTVASVRFEAEEAQVEVRGLASGEMTTLRCARVISTIPVDRLLEALAHDPDANRVASTVRLTYREIILIVVALDRAQVSPDSWTYFPSPDLLFGRSHEPKNWSAQMVPDARHSSLGLEVFCSEGDSTWTTSDRALTDRAIDELESIGWIRRAEVVGSWVERVPYAYPVYTLDYKQRLEQIAEVLRRWPRLTLTGRTGSFRYLNVDGIIEDCLDLALTLGLRGEAVRPLAADAGRWI
jgi:protoporphyrinogen oxidase